jgi:tetratricopeptide (TPR) repeat protein
MPGADLYARAINWPGPVILSAMFISGAVLIIAATVLLSWDKWRSLARVMGAVGVLIVMLTLLDIHEQKVVERPSPELTVVRYKFPEFTRFQIRVALLSLPLAAIVVAASIFVSGKRRRLLLVPGYLKAGLKHYYNREFDRAMEQYDEAIAISPNRGESYHQRGCVFAALGDNTRALDDFDKAIRFDPRLTPAFINRGRLRILANDLDGALDDFERAMILKPNDPAVILNRGYCFAKLGAYPKAIADFQRVLKLTNHTDYAEPATRYLRDLGVAVPSAADEPPINGTLPGQPSASPKSSDLIG